MPTSGAGTSPTIEPVAPDADRPFWSVMIPTFRASALLETALRSVLDQDPGPEVMQITVVDDCSPDRESERIAEGLAPGRVEFQRNPANVGLAANWNECIARARGRWVHILHQDDVVLPGFYERLGLADRERPEAGAAFSRHIIMDGDGHWVTLSSVERREPGVLEGWLARISRMQLIQCASIVVRRDVYERLGGYRGDLAMALDWEMWSRIAAHYPVWFEPRPLACWRVHFANESSRLRRAGVDIPDVLRAIDIIRGYVPDELRDEVGKGLLEQFRFEKLAQANERLFAGDREGGMDLVRQACLCDPALRNSRAFWNYRKWSLKLRLKELLSNPGRRRTAPGGGPTLP